MNIYRGESLKAGRRERLSFNRTPREYKNCAASALVKETVRGRGQAVVEIDGRIFAGFVIALMVLDGALGATGMNIAKGKLV